MENQEDAPAEEKQFQQRRELEAEQKELRKEAKVLLSEIRSTLMQPHPTSEDLRHVQSLTSKATNLLRDAEIKQVAAYSLYAQDELLLALWILHINKHKEIPISALSVSLVCVRGFLIPKSWTGLVESVTAREHLTRILERGVGEGFVTRHVETSLICNDCGATIYSENLPDSHDESGTPYRATLDALKDEITTDVLPEKWTEWTAPRNVVETLQVYNHSGRACTHPRDDQN